MAKDRVLYGFAVSVTASQERSKNPHSDFSKTGAIWKYLQFIDSSNEFCIFQKEKRNL